MLQLVGHLPSQCKHVSLPHCFMWIPTHKEWVQNSFCYFFAQVLELLWLSFLVPSALYLQQFGTRICHVAWYYICYILAWSLCILHGICYIWPCLPSILHGICHVLALQLLICMVFATFWCFKRSCGFLECFFRLSFRVSLGSFRVSCRVSLGFL